MLDVGVWDAATFEPAWHATTESYSLEEHSQQVSTVADFMIEVLRERGLT